MDFQDPEFVRNPYPAYQRLRELGPVVYHEGIGQYLVTGWRDNARILGNVESFASDEEFFIGLFGGLTMEAMEKDRHDPVRSIWAKDFQRPTLEAQRAMVTEVIEAALMPFIEKVKSGETVEAVHEMTRGIPTVVIARMLGIPPEDFRQFSAWSDAMGGIPEGESDPTPRGAEIVRQGKQATADLNAYIAGEVAKRRTNPSDDLIGTMVSSPISETMDLQEIVASNTQLVFAGNETTAKLMAHTLNALALYPDQRRMLVEDRSLIPQALEEIHRWNTIVHLNWRVARNGGATVGDHRLDDGSMVMCLTGAANRDPDRWERAEELDILRPSAQHLGFGFGMHSCIGLNLARMEAQIWLNRLLDELPEWDVAELDWGSNWVLRGPAAIHIAAA